MRFVLNNIILWQKNGTKRTIDFEPNKINVITGDSGTGKSVLIEIIDYCLFASDPDISHDVVNENVDWYGINFNINDKHYTIARACLQDEGRVASKSYFFSPIGKVPDSIALNAKEDELKSIIEYEFSIDKNIVFSYGGNVIKPGTKISFRYFMLFNTLRGDTISHSKDFFDKQYNERYREALPRIFDLATGINNIKNILLNEKIMSIEKEIVKYERKQRLMDKENKLFEKELNNIIKKAKEYLLIDDDVNSAEEGILRLEDMINNLGTESPSTEISEVDILNKEKRNVIRKIKLIKEFKAESLVYKELITKEYDSLRPVEYISNNYEEILQNSSINEFIYSLEIELKKIKKYISGKSPLTVSVNKKIDDLEKEVYNINQKITLYPDKSMEFDNDRSKYVFIGEVKNQLNIYKKNYQDDNYNEEIEKRNNELTQLKDGYVDVKDNREMIIKLLEELIQQYLDQTGSALDNYEGYKAYFNYSKKTLQLRKPLSLIPSKVGSSSNHLFLHLCLFLGLHELIINQNSQYVPGFLVLDQPSRPYFEIVRKAKKLNSIKEVNFIDIVTDDRSKITTVFKLLNDFVNHINKEYNKEFQMIVFEHIPKSIWEDAKLNNVHLVEEFIDGNALVK